MNYIAEIKGFYDLVLTKPLSTGQIALWHALMHINNKCAWKTWFDAPNLILELLTGLSRQAIANNRNYLKQIGLISFKTNGTKATSYMLKSCQASLQANSPNEFDMSNSLQDTLQDTCQHTLQDTLQDTCQSSCTLDKHKRNETKLNETFIKKESNKQKKDNAPKGDEASVLFESFWAVYPKRVSRSSAVKAFNKIKPDEELLAVMISAVEKQKQSEQWRKDNGQFIPHPATWLNQRRWEDDINVQQPEKSQEEVYRELGINLFRKGVDDQ